MDLFSVFKSLVFLTAVSLRGTNGQVLKEGKSYHRGTLISSFLLFYFPSLLSQASVGCFSEGACRDALTLTELEEATPNECLAACKDYDHDGPQDFECNYFSHFLATSVST